jgi:diacylglycerol O-acyltransferase
MAERLTALDASFLMIETPSIHMHVGGLVILDPSTRPDGRLGFGDVWSLVERRIHLTPRFRQKIMTVPMNLGRPVWVDDPHFDLDFHLRRAALPAPGSRRELTDFVQRVHSRPLDRTKSLWEMYFIEGLEDGLVALMTKIHHCMIDGVSGMDIATVLLDLTAEPRKIDAVPYKPEPEPAARELVLSAIREQFANPVRAAVDTVTTAVRMPRRALELGRQTAGGMAEFVSVGRAPSSPLDCRVGPNRRLAIFDAPVDDFKTIKNALGGTVNDVVLAVVAGGLHRLLEGRGIETRGMELRTMVPVSTRTESERMQLGNRVTTLFADLPAGPMSEVDRLHAMTVRTGDLKSSHKALGAQALVGLGTWAPPTLHALAARLMSGARFLNLVVSNVPGPQVPTFFNGARVMAHYPLMPLSEDSALSVAVTSLSGVMAFGLTGEWDALPDVEELGHGMLATLDELKKVAL